MISLKILAVINAVLILVYGIGAYFVIPQFEELLIQFGADLPFITNIMICSYKYWLILIIIPLFIYLKYLRTPELSKTIRNRIIIVLIPMLIFLSFFLMVVVYAMYAPIFELGAVSD